MGGHVNVPCTSYRIYCDVAKISGILGIVCYVTCCYAAEISGVFYYVTGCYAAEILGIVYYVTCCYAAEMSCYTCVAGSGVMSAIVATCCRRQLPH